MEPLSRFLKHTGCEICGSSDAKALYSNGTAYCFSCNTFFRNNKKIDVIENINFNAPYPIVTKIRGIYPETFNKYHYYKNKDGNHLINHFDASGRLVAQKLRYRDKTFSWVGYPQKATLFGQHLFNQGDRIITITEGELDALSVAQAFDLKYPVVSINNGAQSALKECKKQYDFLNSFEKIYIWFDNDKYGIEASKEVAQLFLGKSYIITHQQYKDANEILQKEGEKEIVKTFYKAQEYKPDGIVKAKDIIKDLWVEEEQSDYLYPYKELNIKTDGLRKKELITITAGTGIGKSTLAREIAFGLLTKQGASVGYIALEENNKRTLQGFIGMELNKPLYLKSVRKKVIDNDYQKLIEATNKIAKLPLYLYDHFGSLEGDNLIEKIKYLIKVKGVDFIILDHISIVISGLEINDERKAIDVMMTKLRSLVEETGAGVIVISHLRRPLGDKGYEDGKQITLSALRGSGAIAQLSDVVIALERNQQANDEEKNITTVRLLKCRYTGETGIAGELEFNKETGRLLEVKEFDEEQNVYDIDLSEITLDI